MTTTQATTQKAEQTMTTITMEAPSMSRIAIIYSDSGDYTNQTMLVVDMDKDGSTLVADWMEVANTMCEKRRAASPMHTAVMGSVVKPMTTMVEVPCKGVKAIVVSTTTLGGTKDRKLIQDKTKVEDAKKYGKAMTDAMMYYKAIADAQVYAQADGLVQPYNGYGKLMEEMEYDNRRLLPMDQHTYVRRPTPGGHTLRLNPAAANGAGMVENLGTMDANGQQTWIDPHGHEVTVEEYIAGIDARVAPRHHCDDAGTMSLYQVDEMHMNIQEMTYVRRLPYKKAVRGTDVDLEMALRAIVMPNTEHYVYTEAKKPAGTSIGIVYLAVPEVATSYLDRTEYQYGVTATVPVSAKNKSDNLDHTMRHHLCTKMIPRCGHSILNSTPSARTGYLMKEVEVAEGKYRYEKMTCQEVHVDGTVCGGYYKPDSQGNQYCLECGAIHEMSVEDIRAELHRQSGSATPRVEYRPEDVETDVEQLDEDETSEETEDDTTEPESETEAEVRNIKNSALLGGKAATGTVGETERRLDRNLAAWKGEKVEQPAAEKKAAKKQHDRKQQDHECKVANTKKMNAAKKKADQRTMYGYMWTKRLVEYAKRCILARVADGMNTSVELVKVVPGCDDTYYKYQDELVAAGRITKEKVGRKTVLTLVPREYTARPEYPAKYDGRKYGNTEYVRGTIKPAAGLYMPKTTARYTYPAAEHHLCPIGKADKDYPLAKTGSETADSLVQKIENTCAALRAILTRAYAPSQ